MEFAPRGWTDAELDESILKLCEEFPDSRMAACSRAVERCRQMAPGGTPEALLSTMRGALQEERATEPANSRGDRATPSMIHP